MRIKSLAMVGLVAGLSATAVTASAEEELQNWVGASFGTTDFNTSNLSGISGTADDSGNGWKVYLGFPITQHIGLEAGYVNLGKESVSGSSGETASARSTRNFNFDVVGSYDASENISLFGKAGIYRWSMHSDRSPASNYTTADDDGFNFTYGLGFQFNPNKELGLRLEWERFNNLGFKGTTGEADVDLYTVGAVYKFKFF